MALRTPFGNDAKTYGFEWLRYLSEIDNQEGVVNPGDLKVTAAAGGGQRVDIAAGVALVKGDSGVAALGLTQGLFTVVNDASVPNAVTLAASDATNARIDQICLRVRDSSDLGTGADDATFVVVAGAPTAAATLDNRNGAVAVLPNDHLRLADVIVPAASSVVVAGNVRDRRPWARGARELVSVGRAADVLFTSAGMAALDSAVFRRRLETSGNPVTIRAQASIQAQTAGAAVAFGFLLDGVAVAESPGSVELAYMSLTGNSGWIPASPELHRVIAAGSHLFDLAGYVSAGTGRLLAAHQAFAVQEWIGAAANNGTA